MTARTTTTWTGAFRSWELLRPPTAASTPSYTCSSTPHSEDPSAAFAVGVIAVRLSPVRNLHERPPGKDFTFPPKCKLTSVKGRTNKHWVLYRCIILRIFFYTFEYKTGYGKKSGEVNKHFPSAEFVSGVVLGSSQPWAHLCSILDHGCGWNVSHFAKEETEAWKFVQAHTAGKWQGWDPNVSASHSRAYLLSSMPNLQKLGKETHKINTHTLKTSQTTFQIKSNLFI